uniref:Uncharacterized protein DKFZp469M0931 n=1 Tax=Pongo abelii TaxID=9601 RepID=Q5R5D7_PONAB|nr:hypothetical protein [Pongo abelii]
MVFVCLALLKRNFEISINMISEREKSYSMAYVWKGVKILLKGLFTLMEGCKDSFERFIHIVEQQMTFLQYFFVKQTILCLEFGICVLVKHCKSELLPLYLNVYHPLVNYYKLLCDCFFFLECLV